ncbi:Hypothetical protein NCS54_00436500 [Fusarium falciforme]|uniref:Hypothetical protein n=1 Tax=Fusarium falciforme TaxID=195108 RepID=UPI002300CAC3|nr:Hypothetical protein NCS54_00436500 [Fusarium falciforme]WAO87070.1 Hypothetical protein NCS54_00436500 [Fusarium falciforme]
MSWCGTCDYSHWAPHSPSGECEPWIPRTCIRPCCRLCRFSIKCGQDIVAFTRDGRQSPTLPFPGEVEEVKTPELKAAFKSCFGETCGHYNDKGFACHAGCAALAERLGLTPAEYLPALAYSYEPPKSDERRRRELVRFRLQQALKRNLGRLPTEVWDYVAKDLVCEFATVAIPVVEPKTVFTIDPLEAVWAKYVDIDGVKYVKSVSNEHKPGDRLLWDKPKSPTGHVVYIAEDHLGINEITNHPEFTQSAQSKGVSSWWRTVPAEDSSTIGFKTDGVKLRSFSATALLPEVKWPYPMPPDEINGMSLYYTMLDREAKLIPVDINAPDTIGYSVGWHYGCVYLHAHKRGESLDFYHELDMRQTEVETKSAAVNPNERHEPHAVKVARMAEESDIEWRYHPLNAGEAIEQVWVRQPRKLPQDEDDHDDSPYGPRYLWSDSPRDIAIGLVTNQSRTLVLGLPCDIPHERFPWRCIAKSSTASPMRIFFSYSLSGINLFAAPKSIASDEEPIPEDLYEEEPNNFCLYGYDFHTSASLEDVAQVVTCKAIECIVINQEKPYINGLLFRYKDGSERTVGKFRLDCAQPPISFDESPTLFLGIGKCGSPAREDEHVVDVRLSAPKDRGGLKWKKFSAKEPLQWSWRQCWTKISSPSREFGHSSDSEEDD